VRRLPVSNVVWSSSNPVVEPFDEQPRHPREVDRHGIEESRHAALGQRDDDPATVGV